MAKNICYMDESFTDKVFCLCGVIIDDQNTYQIIEKMRNLKKMLGLDYFDYLKFSPDDKCIKSKLQSTFSNERDWITHYRTKVFDTISTFNILLLVSLHQDRRTLLSYKPSAVDFYLCGEYGVKSFHFA